MLTIGAAKPLVLCSFLVLAVFACNRSADSAQDSTQVAQSAQTPNPDAPIMLRGTVMSVSANQLVLKSDTGAVTVTVGAAFPPLYSGSE